MWLGKEQFRAGAVKDFWCEHLRLSCPSDVRAHMSGDSRGQRSQLGINVKIGEPLENSLIVMMWWSS